MELGESLSEEMRKAIRKAHALSSKMTRAKLAFTISSDDVWSEGVMVFYEIFKYLELAMSDNRNENLAKLLLPGLSRTQAFEEDLNYYYGRNWRLHYEIRETVGQYLAHMQNLYDTDPDLLIPYVYQLYMGLLSAGQLMKRKRDLENLFANQNEVRNGEAVTDFGIFKISELKIRLRMMVDHIGYGFDDEKRARLVDECATVLYLNNSLVQSISSSTRVAAERAVFFLFGIVAMIIAHFLLAH